MSAALSWFGFSPSQADNAEMQKEGLHPCHCQQGQDIVVPSQDVKSELEHPLNLLKRSLVKKQDQLECGPPQDLQLLRRELHAEIAKQSRILREEMSELPSLCDLHAFGEFQAKLTGQHAGLRADLAELAKMVSCLAAGLASDHRAGSVATLNDHEASDISECEAEFAAPSALKAETSVASNDLKSTTTRCQSAMTAVRELHQQVIWQCEHIVVRQLENKAVRMGWEEVGTISLGGLDAQGNTKPPSQDDVLHIIDAFRALKVDDARLCASIAKHKQQLNSVSKQNVEFHEESQRQLAAFQHAQQLLAAQVVDLAQEQEQNVQLHQDSHERLTACLKRLEEISMQVTELTQEQQQSVQLHEDTQRWLTASLKNQEELTAQVASLALDVKVMSCASECSKQSPTLSPRLSPVLSRRHSPALSARQSPCLSNRNSRGSFDRLKPPEVALEQVVLGDSLRRRSDPSPRTLSLISQTDNQHQLIVHLNSREWCPAQVEDFGQKMKQHEEAASRRWPIIEETKTHE